MQWASRFELTSNARFPTATCTSANDARTSPKRRSVGAIPSWRCDQKIQDNGKVKATSIIDPKPNFIEARNRPASRASGIQSPDVILAPERKKRKIDGREMIRVIQADTDGEPKKESIFTWKKMVPMRMASR